MKTFNEPKEIKEGIHYYIEGRYRVYTELYHRERGFCCANGCRHCVFEPKHQRNAKNLKKD
jgi:hypothetical protein